MWPYAHAGSSDSSEDDGHTLTEESYDFCTGAANHITSIGTSPSPPRSMSTHVGLPTVSVYLENYCLKRSPVFLCYYIFTASIMHVTTRTSLSLSLSLFPCNRVATPPTDAATFQSPDIPPIRRPE